MLSDESLFNFYQTNSELVLSDNYTLSELEQMLPWEREVYINLLLQHLKDEKQRLENNGK